MGVMKIAWLSARVLANDLCDTTQIALAEGLVNHNFDLTFYSPGSLTNSKFNPITFSEDTMEEGLEKSGKRLRCFRCAFLIRTQVNQKSISSD